MAYESCSRIFAGKRQALPFMSGKAAETPGPETGESQSSLNAQIWKGAGEPVFSSWYFPVRQA